MAIFDRFKKSKAETSGPTAEHTKAITDPNAPTGPDDLRPGMLLQVLLGQSDLAVPFRDSEVQAANRVAAEDIAAGEHRHLPGPVVEWIQDNVDNAVSPTHFGYTWYAGHTNGQMQLVDTRTLEMDPNPYLGSVLWGSRCVIDSWTVSPIEFEPLPRGVAGLMWSGPVGFAEFSVLPADNRLSYALILPLAAQLGSESLAREFSMTFQSALQRIDGFSAEGLDDAILWFWGIVGPPGAEEAILRAAVLSLYSIGDRLPPELCAAMPVADFTNGIPSSLIAEIAAELAD